MTKANKLLVQLRTTGHGTMPCKGRYSSVSTDVFYREMSYLNSIDNLKASLEQIRKKFNNKLLGKKLMEKWKNKLFELNIRYGIHTVLSTIDLLRHEKNMISEVLQAEADASNNFVDIDVAIAGMDAVHTSERKYDFKWKVSAFNRCDFEKRLKDISKEISKLDELKDRLNFENTFSIELSAEERDMLGI